MTKRTSLCEQRARCHPNCRDSPVQLILGYNYFHVTRMTTSKGRLLSYFLINVLLSPMAFAAALSPIEQQIKNYIAQHQSEQLSLLESLVNVNSGTTNIVGVQHVGARLRVELDKLGFTTQWIKEPPDMHRAGTLIARRTGTMGKKLLLIGHLDTVFPINSSFQTYKRHKSTAIGPGVVDDKGGDMVILYALKALQASHALESTNITVVLTGDEEESGKPAAISRKPLFDAARNSDIALDFECALSNDTASIARRGITNWTLRSQGHEAHSSDIFRTSVGYGANFELIRILNTFRTELSKEHDVSFNPGLLLGGTTTEYDQNNSRGSAFGRANVIAKTAFATGDLRYVSPEQKQAIEKRMLQVVANHLPETRASIKFQDGIPAMPPTKSNLRLLEQYSQASSDLGYGTIKPDQQVRGAGDISYIASMVSANLVGLGPEGSGMHSTEETLDILSLMRQSQRAALLIYRLTHRD